MTQEVDRWDAEEWLQKNKDIWNHPMVTDRTDSNAYEVADLMAEFANYILDKQKQKQLIIDIMNEDAKDGLYKQQTAVEWLFSQLPDHLRLSEDGFDTLQQAKEREKKNINSTAVNCYTEGFRDRGKGVTSKELMSYYEGYYDRVFGDTSQSDE